MKRILAAILLLTMSWVVAARDVDTESKLYELFDREWETRLQEFPRWATSVGVHDYNDRLTAMAPEDLERRDGLWRGFLAELDSLDTSELSDFDRINLEIFRDQLEARVASYRFGAHEIPFNADSGFFSGFARLPVNVPLATTADYDNYLARLRAWPQLVEHQIGYMRRGLERGMSQPQAVLAGIDEVIASQIHEDATQSGFFAPFSNFPAAVLEADQKRLRTVGEAVVRDQVMPAYQALQTFMVDEYMVQARETLGAHDLPEGESYYASQIRFYTSLDLTPQEIHDIGLAEVARIREEMDAIIEEVEFDGTFAEFLDFLRTDPQFYPKTADELLKEAAWISKRMDGKLPSLFKTLPRLPYTVEPVPDSIAPKYTAGRYVGPPEGSTQPGRYWVNTYALDTRSLYNLEALSLHEGVPGHHFQNAIARELDNLPNFRRYSYISAFGEGWGLYSEWLGLEAGFYTDPYSNFGRLTYEMWRACRLVVDTGVHALGWSRQQVLDYLAANTALSIHEVTTETDRYISWPAQALSYKLGEIKIKELRRRAETQLGDRFDVRTFHDAVLSNGSVPLSVLEEVIDQFIAEQLDLADDAVG